MSRSNEYERKKIFMIFFMKIKNHVRVTASRSMTTYQRIMIFHHYRLKIKILKKMTKRQKNSKNFFFDRNRVF